MARFRLLYIFAIATSVTLTLQLLFLYRYRLHSIEVNSKTSVSGKMVDILTRNAVNTVDVRCANNGAEMLGASKEQRQKRRLTIGIPTIKRNKIDYFRYMLRTMFNKTSNEDLKEIVFVIFLADFNNIEWKSSMESEIKRNYSHHIESGSLLVIQAPKSFYNAMKYFGNDSYRNWRTKQNYDYAYLMKYCENLSEYYMQMEDDVVARDGYYTAITNFIRNQTDDNWVCLEFSLLGFIGKLYHSSHIGNLAALLIMFSQHQPVDYTYIYFNILMNSGCILRKPTLFQHNGYVSSLVGKDQPLKDKYFDFPEKTVKGDNPPALISTTLKIDPDFSPNLAYSRGPGYFWSGAGANVNDTFTIVFRKAQSLDKIVIETGSKDHPTDVIHSAILEVSNQISHELSGSCVDFITLAFFANGLLHVDSTGIMEKVGLVKIRCLQVRFTLSQTEWVIIREIAVFLKR